MYGIDIVALRWGIGIVIFFVVVWFIVAKKLLKSEPVVKKVNMSSRYDDMSDNELECFGIKSNQFKQMVYKKFCDVHNALTNYDYDILDINLTHDLYQYYTEQLEILKKKRHRNVMKDFELIDVKIYKVSNEHDLLRVEVYLNVRMLDYTIDDENGICIKGTDSEKVEFEFELCVEKRRKGEFLISKKSCVNDVLLVDALKEEE